MAQVSFQAYNIPALSADYSSVVDSNRFNFPGVSQEVYANTDNLKPSVRAMVKHIDSEGADIVVLHGVRYNNIFDNQVLSEVTTLLKYRDNRICETRVSNVCEFNVPKSGVALIWDKAKWDLVRSTTRSGFVLQPVTFVLRHTQTNEHCAITVCDARTIDGLDCIKQNEDEERDPSASRILVTRHLTALSVDPLSKKGFNMELAVGIVKDPCPDTYVHAKNVKIKQIASVASQPAGNAPGSRLAAARNRRNVTMQPVTIWQLICAFFKKLFCCR